MESDRTAVTATVSEDAADRTVSDLVFGKFSEHLGGNMYPGVYEDYLRNGSFEVWNESADGPNGLVYPDVPATDGVAYPWEPVGAAGANAFEQVTGGAHGRQRDDALDSGPGVPEDKRPEPAGVTEPRFQRVTVDGRTGVRQRVALPDFRTDEFDLSISVAGDGVNRICAALRDPDGERHAESTVPVGSAWERHEVRLTVDGRSQSRFEGSRYGEYELHLTAEGEGHVDLDRATLIPADAVEGTFNPTTIRLLREFDVTCIRWPGGNYASQYRWRHGIGPVAERPVVPIVNWGGLEPNYLGTNEFLRFCELADVEPYVTVPFWSATGPEEAAAWVEYCNGDPEETEMGRLRAEHGYEEPWDVAYWGIGNEVWGHWQVGNTDAASYAEGYREYRAAMRAVDPDIELDASGLDPWFTTIHDGSYEDTQNGERPVWNETFFEEAGDLVEGLDLHRYVVGIRDDEAREAWLRQHDEDPVGYNELLVNFPGVYIRLLDEVRELAAENDVSDLRLTVGEWNLGPATGVDWPSAEPGTMAHAVFAARMFQAFFRHGDAVRMSHWTDYNLFVHPRPDGVNPPHPGQYVQREMAEPLREAAGEWTLLETDLGDAPTRPYPKTGIWSISMDEIPLVDVVALTGPDDRILAFLTNGQLRTDQPFELDFGGAVDGTLVATEYRGTDGDPFAMQERWDERDGFEVRSYDVDASDGTATLTLPAGSFVKLATRP